MATGQVLVLASLSHCHLAASVSSLTAFAYRETAWRSLLAATLCSCPAASVGTKHGGHRNDALSVPHTGTVFGMLRIAGCTLHRWHGEVLLNKMCLQPTTSYWQSNCKGKHN